MVTEETNLSGDQNSHTCLEDKSMQENTVDSTGNLEIMPVTRMRMRPWLEAKIESKSIPKLVWLDKERKLFSIPWIHGARHGWKMDKDACLFKEWAIHTGKFQPGVTDPDPKTWKANFRCAMNSLEDIEEVKDQSVNKGSGAMRVYRMLQAVPKKGDKRSKTKDSRNKKKNKATASKIKAESMVTEETNLSGDQNSHTCLEDKSMQENTVDSTGNLDLSQPRYEEPVPEWSTSVEIVGDSTNDIYSTFQVSPLHSPEFPDDEAAIIQMTEQLEMDQSQWQQSNINGKGFLSNEVGTADSFPSAENWGFNSGTEIELRFSTELKGGLSENIDRLNYFEPWTNNSTSSLQQITCTL